jgi:diguanylate cyclase (GGDEF)-like protein
VHADGHNVWASVNVSCVRDQMRRPLYFIGQVEDVTESRALRERLAQAAIHDPLTALPNRELFMDRLETSLRLASRDHRRVVVMFLDLDRFKLINDSLGHDVGDQILCAVADRLSSVMRASDTLARFGGDEFTVLCSENHDERGALLVAERLVEAMADPIVLPSGEIFVSLSVGLALSNGDTVSGATLLRDADVAMYQAKSRGPSRVEIYREEDESNVVSRLRTSNELHRALERDELELHYQPIVDLHTETLVGMEALVRWRHPTRGLLSPLEFIPLAEDSGLIAPVGAWVLNEACQQTAAWTASCACSDYDEAGLNIAVNVSALQLGEPGFPNLVAETLESTGVLPDRLWLEITESALMRDPDDTASVLLALRDLGVHLEIDDFGTGYSSLSYLQRFPVETLKIDRSFVDGMERDAGSVAIVKAIIGLGRALGLSVIAEGVERTAEAAKLQALGCHLAQGYLYGRPLPASALGYVPAPDFSSWQPRLSAAS